MNNIEFALKMELEGEKYYTQQAEKNKNNSLKTVFVLLARDEQNHAEILKNKFNELTYELKDNNSLSEVKNVFKEIKDFKKETKDIPDQSDLYSTALDIEKQSIDLYKKLLSEATDDKEKLLFEYLLKQEKEHYAILEEIVLLINRPKDWVENAEFGVREEY